MQVFLSEPTFLESVRVLDGKRLQKQFLECWQMLDAISKTPEGGGSRVDGKVPFASNHPVTNMWRGHERLLEHYAWLCEIELTKREFQTAGITKKIISTVNNNPQWAHHAGMPEWWTDGNSQDKIIYTHRASLYNKNPEHYAQYIAFAENLDLYRERLVCCPGKHADYFYPTHMEK